MDNNRNFFITIALSIVILTAWQVLYMNPRIEAQREAQQVEAEREAAKQPEIADTDPSIPQPEGAGENVPDAGVEDGGTSAARIRIDSPKLSGSINLAGARLDDIILKDYRVTVEPNSPNIKLLEPVNGGNGYFTEVGFTGAGNRTLYPGADTVWSVSGNETLTPTSPVNLTYDNGNGVVFNRRISVDQNYLFTIEDRVTNNGEGAVALAAYGRITRPQTATNRRIFYSP